MRNTQLRPPATSVFTSKRFVVALCAAIAMVLGAMSVGSNTPSGYEDAAVTTPPSIANRASIFMRSNPDGQQRADPAKPLIQSYFSYQMPTPPANTGESIPVTNTPAKTLEIKLNLRSLEASISTPSTVLLLESDDVSPSVTVPTDTAITIDQTLQTADAPAGDTPSQAVEPDAENTPADTPLE